jgi:hypothetical protein
VSPTFESPDEMVRLIGSFRGVESSSTNPFADVKFEVSGVCCGVARAERRVVRVEQLQVGDSRFGPLTH